jgi:hypothetical protein
MDSALVACLDRVRHANMHIGSLKRAFRTYISGDAYRTETQVDLGNLTQPETVVYATLLKEPPAQLGLLVSDTINDLRGALDNLVWALTIKHSGLPPRSMSRVEQARWRQVSFPSAVTSNDWKSVRGNNLWGVEPRLLADFEALQPYRRRQRDPDRDEFRILNEMWNRDKHRQPTVVVVPVGLHSVTSDDLTLDRFKDYSFEIVKQRRVRPLKGRTEIGRIREIKRDGVPWLQPEMNVEYSVSFGIVFEKGPPAYGMGVYATLESCRDAVQLALRQFESEFS